MRQLQKRDKSGNGRKLSGGNLPWVIQQIASGFLPVLGSELGKTIATAITTSLAPWLWHWLFG